MKNISNFFKLLTLLIMMPVCAQSTLPLTGFRIEKSGLDFEKIRIDLDGGMWISNRLPVETDFEIKLEEPSGFEEIDGEIHYGMELLMSGLAGDTLGYLEDMYAGSGIEYNSPEELKSLTLTLGFNPETPVGDTIKIYARFFDYNSEKYLIVENDLIITDSDKPLEVSYNSYHSLNYSEDIFAGASEIAFSNFEYAQNPPDGENFVVFNKVEIADLAEFKKLECRMIVRDEYGNEQIKNFSLNNTDFVEIEKNEDGTYKIYIKSSTYKNVLPNNQVVRYRIEQKFNQVLEGGVNWKV